MSEGVNETKEFLVAAVKLGKFVASHAKDGVDWSDAIALGQKIATDGDFRSALFFGIAGLQNVPSEIKDLTFPEGVELLTSIINEIRQ
jgi:hypothetical protein